jgi:hypothetical protein
MPTVAAIAAVKRSLARNLLGNARLVLLLHWAEGLSAAEIGAVLEESAESVEREIGGIRNLAKAGLRTWELC